MEKKNVDKPIGVLGHAESLMCVHSSAQGRCEKWESEELNQEDRQGPACKC